MAPELLAEMNQSYRTLHGMLVARHGELEAARVLAKLLGCAENQGEQTLAEALTAALAKEPTQATSPSPQTEPKQATLPPRLAAIQVAAARAADYDALLTGGVQ